MRPELGCGRSPGAVASGDLALGGVCAENAEQGGTLVGLPGGSLARRECLIGR
jgi:hypothetical protein